MLIASYEHKGIVLRWVQNIDNPDEYTTTIERDKQIILSSGPTTLKRAKAYYTLAFQQMVMEQKALKAQVS